MKLHPLLTLVIVASIAGSPLFATAQTAAVLPTAAASAASAPAADKTGPRRVTPTELNQNASPPGELRPESAVIPQISIPLGETSAAPIVLNSGSTNRSKAAPAGGIDDAAARCEAQADKQARAVCRSRIKN